MLLCIFNPLHHQLVPTRTDLVGIILDDILLANEEHFCKAHLHSHQVLQVPHNYRYPQSHPSGNSPTSPRKEQIQLSK